MNVSEWSPFGWMIEQWWHGVAFFLLWHVVWHLTGSFKAWEWIFSPKG